MTLLPQNSESGRQASQASYHSKKSTDAGSVGTTSAGGPILDAAETSTANSSKSWFTSKQEAHYFQLTEGRAASVQEGVHFNYDGDAMFTHDVATDTTSPPPVWDRDLTKLSAMNKPPDADSKSGAANAGDVTLTTMEPLTAAKPRSQRSSRQSAGRSVRRDTSSSSPNIGRGTLGLEERVNPNHNMRERQPLSLLNWNMVRHREHKAEILRQRQENYACWRETMLKESTFHKFSASRKMRGQGDSDTQFEVARLLALQEEREKKAKAEKEKRQRHEQQLLADRQKWKRGEGVNLPDAYYRSAFETLTAAQHPGAPQSVENVTLSDHRRAQQVQQVRIDVLRADKEEERRDEAAKLRQEISEQLAESRRMTNEYIEAIKTRPSPAPPPQERTVTPPRKTHPCTSRLPKIPSREDLSNAGPSSPEKTTETSRAPSVGLPTMHASSPPGDGEALNTNRPISGSGIRATSSSGGGAFLNRVGAPGATGTGQTATTHLLSEMQTWNTSFKSPNSRPLSGSDPQHRQRWLQQLTQETLDFNRKTAELQRESSLKANESRVAWMDENNKRVLEEREEKVQHQLQREDFERREMSYKEAKHDAYRHQQMYVNTAKQEDREDRKGLASLERATQNQGHHDRAKLNVSDLSARREIVTTQRAREKQHPPI